MGDSRCSSTQSRWRCAACWLFRASSRCAGLCSLSRLRSGFTPDRSCGSRLRSRACGLRGGSGPRLSSNEHSKRSPTCPGWIRPPGPTLSRSASINRQLQFIRRQRPTSGRRMLMPRLIMSSRPGTSGRPVARLLGRALIRSQDDRKSPADCDANETFTRRVGEHRTRWDAAFQSGGKALVENNRCGRFGTLVTAGALVGGAQLWGLPRRMFWPALCIRPVPSDPSSSSRQCSRSHWLLLPPRWVRHKRRAAVNTVQSLRQDDDTVADGTNPLADQSF